MKLLLRTESGEAVEFDVLPSDTFADLSQRLLEHGKVAVNLEQLSSKGRPVGMSANVMEYFNVGSRKINTCATKQSDEQNNNSKDDNQDELQCNGTNDNISNSEGEKIKVCNSPNSSIQETSLLSKKEKSSLRCTEDTESFADKIKLGLEHVKRTKLICRLCAQATDCFSVKYVYDDPPLGESLTLADKINCSLPIYVSQEDNLPKQICAGCLLQLETSYKFARMVIDAEVTLEEMDFQIFSDDKCYGCPFCEGHMSCEDKSSEDEKYILKSEIDNCQNMEIIENEMEINPSEILKMRGRSKKMISNIVNDVAQLPELEPSIDDLGDPLNYEIITQHYALNEYAVPNYGSHEILKPSVTENNTIEIRRKRGRPRKIGDKKSIDDDDKDWTVKEDLKPVKKRGRPKGSKNKPPINKFIEVDCIICERTFPDIPSVLAHTLLCHCEDGSNCLPCPLCHTVWSDEGELVYHVNNHSTTYQVIINPCLFCTKAYKEKGELEQHLLEEHIKLNSYPYQCPVCKNPYQSSMTLASHLADLHTYGSYTNSWECPTCNSSFNEKEAFMHHFLTVHLPANKTTNPCPRCEEEITSEKGLVRHLIQSHCTEYVIERPLQYKCPACNSKFKSQYNLIKHPCTSIGSTLHCNECGISFPIKARYVLHLQFHHDNINFEMRCDVCLAEFDEEDNFYDHIRFQHETDQNLECSQCKKTFKNNSSLTIHMRRHQEIRKHKCESCGKTFKNAQTLREHSVSHMEVKPYQCQECGQCLSRPSRLRLHLRSHSVQRSNSSMTCYCCCECSQVFPNSEQAQYHCEQHQNQSTQGAQFTEISLRQVLRCEFCDACYITPNDLNNHRTKFHNNPDSGDAFTCRICGSKFSSYARVATHKLSHGINTETLILSNEDNTDGQQTDSTAAVQFTVPQYFVCEICNKECLHYTYLNMHRKLCHPQSSPSHSCKYCCQLFPTAWALHYHRRKMHNLRSKISKTCKTTRKQSEDNLYECPQCLRQYASPETLDVHMKRLHVRTSKQYAGYICETCGKTFAFKGSWQSHCDAHNGIKRFQCNDCDKRFTHKAGLTKHMKLHSTDRPFLCEYCGKKFRDRTERDNHIRAHTGERPFMCHICGRTFHTRAVWLDHSRIHEDLRPHHCDQCGQSFRRSFALKSHYLIHTGERPFDCKICGKDFRLKQSLTTHMKKDHENITDSVLQISGDVISRKGRDLVIIDETEYDLADEVLMKNDGEEEVTQETEDEMIGFNHYEQYITKSISNDIDENKDSIKSELISPYESTEFITDEQFINKSINNDDIHENKDSIKSELISPYVSTELITDQDNNIHNTEKDLTPHNLFTDKSSLPSLLNTSQKLIITDSSVPVNFSEIKCSESCTKKTFKKTVHIPIVYCKQDSNKRRKVTISTTIPTTVDLPMLKELCQIIEDPTESK